MRPTDDFISLCLAYPRLQTIYLLARRDLCRFGRFAACRIATSRSHDCAAPSSIPRLIAMPSGRRFPDDSDPMELMEQQLVRCGVPSVRIYEHLAMPSPLMVAAAAAATLGAQQPSAQQQQHHQPSAQQQQPHENAGHALPPWLSPASTALLYGRGAAGSPSPYSTAAHIPAAPDTPALPQLAIPASTDDTATAESSFLLPLSVIAEPTPTSELEPKLFQHVSISPGA
ncbi:T-box transcription factor TBX20 [Temnothorax longispinosus]|uniref:T-box transcription factor TBX20 n=1 Tax=Temnothorax longispinosus TaxID=300112 RepID=A0A4S2JBH4_9HYME|nr:T-box transcription factor TBX20 [Temnothorax longispinosus]